MTNLNIRYLTAGELAKAKERAHVLRSQAIDHAFNDVVAGAIRSTVSALKRGAQILFLPSEVRHW